jgi:hypothetical protein
MIGIADPGQAETALAAGTLACPGCTRPLRPRGHARTRTVRDHGTTTLALRPRRARCRTCRVTHVLLLAAVTSRRADTTAVIRSALLASARGTGYRRIAAQLDRPLSTVRRSLQWAWLATMTTFGEELVRPMTWVPQLVGVESARIRGLSWANGCRPGGMSCH